MKALRTAVALLLGCVLALSTCTGSGSNKGYYDFDGATKGLLKLGAILAKYDYDYNKALTDPGALEVYGDNDFIQGIGAMEQYYGTQCAAG